MTENTSNPSIELGWQRALLILLPFLFVVTAFEFMGALVIYAPLVYNTEINTAQMLVVTTFGMFGTVLLILIFLRFVDNEPISSIGINRHFSLSQLFYSALFVTLAIGTGFLLLLFFGQIQVQAFDFEMIPFLQSFALFTIAAFGEEIFIRGYILKNLTQSFSHKTALILSSLLFCALHLFNPNIDLISVINLFLAGIVLGIAYLYSGNLWLPLSIHFFWNFIQSHLGFMVSGQSLYSLVKIDLVNNTIWNGGAFGFEGSILSIIFELGAIAFLWRLFTGRKLAYHI